MVWKLDRLSRSLRDVLTLMERLVEAGAGFRSLTEAIDTTTPAGRMMMQTVGAVRRVRAGHAMSDWMLPARKAPSVVRRPKLSDQQQSEIRKNDLQWRQDSRRRCPVVQGSPGNGLADTGATQFQGQEGQPCQISVQTFYAK